MINYTEGVCMAETLEFPNRNGKELENLLQWGRYLYRTSLLFNMYEKIWITKITMNYYI
jgi:hypothetical protein